MNKFSKVFLVAVLATFAFSGGASVAQEPAPATNPARVTVNHNGGSAGPIISEGLDPSGQIRLMVNRHAVLVTRVPARRVSVGQPEIADVNPISATNILVTAKKPGTTQVIVWDDAERSQVVDVVVTF